eukprot:3473745-Rhodomonas_salina.1
MLRSSSQMHTRTRCDGGTAVGVEERRMSGGGGLLRTLKRITCEECRPSILLPPHSSLVLANVVSREEGREAGKDSSRENERGRRKRCGNTRRVGRQGKGERERERERERDGGRVGEAGHTGKEKGGQYCRLSLPPSPSLSLPPSSEAGKEEWCVR